MIGFIIAFACITAGILIYAVIELNMYLSKDKKYNKEVVGEIVDYGWGTTRYSEYPYPIIQYQPTPNRESYRTKYKYASVKQIVEGVTLTKDGDMSKPLWEVDSDGQLIVRRNRTEEKPDPREILYPIGAQTMVHYSSENPKKAYAGEFPSCGRKGTVALIFGLAFLAVLIFLVVSMS